MNAEQSKPIEEQRVRDVLGRSYPDDTPLSGTDSQAEIVAYALDHPTETVEQAADALDYSVQWVASVLKRADESFVTEHAHRERDRLTTEHQMGEWQRGPPPTERPPENESLPNGYAEVRITEPHETVYVVPIDHLPTIARSIVARHGTAESGDNRTR